MDVQAGVWTGQCSNIVNESNEVKFHLILVYFGKYTIILLLTENSVRTEKIYSDVQGAWTSLRSIHTS